jgi:spore coat protein CotH
MKRVFPGILICFLLTQYISAQPFFPENGPLYTDTTVPRIDITINPDTLTWIYDNPESDREFHAVFEFNNGVVSDIIDPVGFRLRGNTSRYSKKKSFRVSFNTFTAGGKYYGVEKLNLNGEHNDPSVMRSKLMWDILRKWEIPAPRANHVQVYINGNNYGLYLNVENIDEEFALSRFGNKDGNLYKCLYPADLDYLGADPDSYKVMSGDRQIYELTTNLEENDYSDLAAFIGVLENSPDERLICDLEALFNTYDYLKIMAADIFCGDWDGYIYNKNNFYLYNNTVTGKMEYIPYDVDNTFGIDWFNIDWAQRNIYDWKRGGSEKRPLYDRIIINSELRQQFTFYAGQLITSTIDMDSLTQSIEARKNMIAPFITSDPYYPLDYGYDYGDFMLSYTNATGAHVKYGLYPYLNARTLSMSQQLESGMMAPVIKYIRHRRDQVQGIMVRAYAEAEALPLSAMLLYTVDGGSNQQAAMHYDGSGIYSVTLSGVPDAAELTYYIVVSDRDGRTNVKPCDAAVIRPLSGDTPLLFINEFMADNEETVTDELGNYSDWIEIYNGDDREVYLGDIYLTDNFDIPDKWQLPGISLAPGGFALFWADGIPASGAYHTSFKLSKEGEKIGLYDNDFLVVDTLSFGLQTNDVSRGRKTDGSIEIVIFHVPTPGKSNNITSAGEVQAPDQLIVYPNPAFDGMIRLNEKINCTIYNSGGIVVFKGNEVDEIDLNNYPAGLYIIATDDGRRVKFIVVRSN